MALGPAWTDSGYVFVDEAGVEYHPHRFTKMFDDAVRRAGVPKIRLHDTRHTMATLMLENRADVRFIQQQLGHAELSTTQIYTQVSIRMLKQVHTATHPGATLSPEARAELEAELADEDAEDGAA